MNIINKIVCAYDGIRYEIPAEDEICPVILETDNPTYDLEKNKDAVSACAKRFGIPSLYPWQRLAIANILDAVNVIDAKKNITSQDIETLASNESEEKLTEIYDEDGVLRGRQIILLPTGAGKSLCFQIPALLVDGLTVIIYPLLALMNDQFRRMQEAGLDPIIFKGGQSAEERKAQFAKMKGLDGTPPAKLIIANPEVLNGGNLLEKIAKFNVSHLAIDEAHCVTEWGDSFRPSYLELNPIIKKLNPSAVTAFTATASPIVLKRIAEILFDGKAHLVRGESDRANIIYFVRHCRVKEPALLAEVKKRKKPMVIFCSSRKRTEQTASFLSLSLNNSDIRFYHAGLKREEKNEVEKWFHSHRSGILVTTCAWGMGVDKKDVKTVIHRDPSPTAEAYAQEAGRGGRDGSIAEALLLWSPDDSKLLDTLPKKQRFRANLIKDFAESGRCRRQVLLLALGEEKAVAQTPDDEEIACSGCDICNGSAIQYNQDEEFLIRFIKKNRRVFNEEEIVNFLGENLENWRARDIKKLVKSLLKDKLIKKHKNFFWKNKLSI